MKKILTTIVLFLMSGLYWVLILGFVAIIPIAAIECLSENAGEHSMLLKWLVVWSILCAMDTLLSWFVLRRPGHKY